MSFELASAPTLKSASRFLAACALAASSTASASGVFDAKIAPPRPDVDDTKYVTVQRLTMLSVVYSLETNQGLFRLDDVPQARFNFVVCALAPTDSVFDANVPIVEESCAPISAQWAPALDSDGDQKFQTMAHGIIESYYEYAVARLKSANSPAALLPFLFPYTLFAGGVGQALLHDAKTDKELSEAALDSLRAIEKFFHIGPPSLNKDLDQADQITGVDLASAPNSVPPELHGEVLQATRAAFLLTLSATLSGNLDRSPDEILKSFSSAGHL